MPDFIRRTLTGIKRAPALSPARRLLRWLAEPLYRRRFEAASRRTEAEARSALASFPRNSNAPAHTLEGKLIVSLTSFTKRFETLPNTLKSLLDQNLKADHTILWIGEADWPNLTPEILSLRDFGLTIERCEDLRSYTKLIHTLEHWPDAFIITADDDQYYPENWVRSLVEAHDPANPAILCRRALGPTRHADGRMKPYAEWERNVPALSTPQARSIFPTGVAGILYPPHSLAPEVLDKTLFQKLSPTEDDLWFYWMGRRAGTPYKRVGPDFIQLIWPGSQQVSLISVNSQGETDRQVRQLEDYFGIV